MNIHNIYIYYIITIKSRQDTIVGANFAHDCRLRLTSMAFEPGHLNHHQQ